MNPLIQIKQTTPVFLVALLLACFAFLPQTQAALPPEIPGDPDGCYPAFTTAEGCNALAVLTGGIGNTAVGWYSLFLAGDASFNTGVGAGALALTSGAGSDSNTAVGTAAMLLNTIGNENTAVGTNALLYNDSGESNTAIGANALFNNTASGNTAIGSHALLSNTTGGTLGTTQNLDVGPNLAVGSQALGNNTIASANTAVGYQALGSITTGFQDTDLGVSTAVGFQTLANASGPGAANDGFGYQALFNLTDGTGNVAIGFLAGWDLTVGDYNIYIGSVGVDGESATIRIGRTLVSPITTRTFISGIREVTTGNNDAINVMIDSDGQLGTMSSSRRFKNEIKPMDKTSEAIHALEPVTFHYKSDNTGTPQFGLIAEEVAEVNPDLVVRDKDGEIYSVRYDAVNAMLLNEFLKEHHKVEALQAGFAQQQKDFQAIVAHQQKQIEALTTGLEKVSAQIELSKPEPQTVLNNQ